MPKYEEPNTLPGLGGASPLGDGRFGHGSDHEKSKKPGRAGALVLRVLGMGRKE